MEEDADVSIKQIPSHDTRCDYHILSEIKIYHGSIDWSWQTLNLSISGQKDELYDNYVFWLLEIA